MGATFSGTITVSLSVSDVIPAGAATGISPYPVLVTYTVPTVQQATTTLAAGTGPNQATKVFATPLTTSVATSIDLTAVYCTDLTQGFANVRAVFVWNTDTNAAHVLKFGDDSVATNLFLGGMKGTHPQKVIQASDAYLDMDPLEPAGWPVTSTSKILRFDPGGNTITWGVVVVGN